MSLVCFDSMFVVWGIKREVTPQTDEYIKRTIHVMRQCEANGDTIIVPSIVLGEVLSSIPEDKQSDFMRAFEQKVNIAPYDVRAALRFSRMWNGQHRERDRRYTRAETKADYMIAAVAVVNGCRCIYSNDQGLKRFAESSIPVIRTDDIIIPPEQLGLLSD